MARTWGNRNFFNSELKNSWQGGSFVIMVHRKTDTPLKRILVEKLKIREFFYIISGC
jgi:hypothetical protein